MSYRFKKVICIAILLMLCACSSTSDIPETSAFPSLKASENANVPSVNPGTPSSPAGQFEPNKSAPIQISLSYEGNTVIEETEIYMAAMEYMRRHPDVYIDLWFTKGINGYDYYKNTTDSLSNKTSADIVMLNSMFSLRDLSASGYLINFDEIIESDSYISRSDFFENILDGMIYENGLYIMPISFSIDSYVMNKEYTHLLDKPFEEYEAIDYKAMMAVYEKSIDTKPDDIPYMSNSREKAIPFIFALDLLDYQNNATDIFNSETHMLVDKAMNFPLISIVGEGRCKSQEFFYAPEINTLFADANAGGGTFNDAYFEYEDFVYTSPLPLSDFSGNVYYTLNEAAVITRSCKEIDTAWDFLKFLMGFYYDNLDSNYNLADYYYSYPIQKEMFRVKMTEYFEWRYEENLQYGRSTSYSKNEAVKRAIEVLEKQVKLPTRRNQINDIELLSVWQHSFLSFADGSMSLTDALKSIEENVRNLLQKY